MRKQKIQEWKRQKRRRQKIPEGRLQKSVKSHFLVGSFGSLQISVKSTVIAIRLLAILEPVLSFDSSPFAGSKVEHRSLRRSFAQQRCPTTMPNNVAQQRCANWTLFAKRVGVLRLLHVWVHTRCRFVTSSG